MHNKKNLELTHLNGKQPSTVINYSCAFFYYGMSQYGCEKAPLQYVGFSMLLSLGYEDTKGRVLVKVVNTNYFEEGCDAQRKTLPTQQEHKIHHYCDAAVKNNSGNPRPSAGNPHHNNKHRINYLFSESLESIINYHQNERS